MRQWLIAASFMPVCGIAEPHWLMRGEGESSSLHQPRRSAVLSLHSETLHIHAHMAIKRKPNILQEFGKQEQTLHCLAHVIFAWLMAALGFNGHANCWSILVCVLTEASTLIYSSSIKTLLWHIWAPCKSCLYKREGKESCYCCRHCL